MPKIYYLPSTEQTESAVKTLGRTLHLMRAAAKEDILTCTAELDVPYWIIANLELGCATDLNLELLHKFITRYKRKTTEEQA